MTRIRSTSTILAATAVAAVVFLASPAPPVGAAPAPAETDESPAARGALTYRIHCAVCHGPEAQGDGPLAEFLKVAPTDLTRLAEYNDETYPAKEIAQIIDGRDEAIGHGPRDMPVWGISFKDPGDDSDQEGQVRRRISDLVAFIESIQG